MAFSKMVGFDVTPRRPSFVDEALESAGGQKRPAHLIEPNALTQLDEAVLTGCCSFQSSQILLFERGDFRQSSAVALFSARFMVMVRLRRLRFDFFHDIVRLGHDIINGKAKMLQ